jgi:hypothetical protein
LALAITTALTLRAVFRLALRQTEGLIASLLRLLDLATDEYLLDEDTVTQWIAECCTVGNLRGTRQRMPPSWDLGGIGASASVNSRVRKRASLRRRSARGSNHARSAMGAASLVSL